jgi:hypothetical protein
MSARSQPEGRRKIVEFDQETWNAIDLLGRDTFLSFQELADEAFRDLLKKHGRPTELKAALRQSVRAQDARSKPVKRRRK